MKADWNRPEKHLEAAAACDHVCTTALASLLLPSTQGTNCRATAGTASHAGSQLPRD